jgi:3-mercaptopyruvate sulfurtransferase SseA
MALLLKSKGFKDVWPLLGGFDAWVELGYPTEAFRSGGGAADETPDAGTPIPKEQDNSWA